MDINCWSSARLSAAEPFPSPGCGSKPPRGHSSAIKQLALLAYVRRLIPPGTPVLLVGDSEFGAVEVIQQLEAWGWQYVLRQKASHLIRLPGGDWQRFGDVIREPGQSHWLGQGQLTREHGHPTNLLAHWEKGEKEPWLLATSLSSRQETWRAYRRRMQLSCQAAGLDKIPLCRR